MKILVVGSHSSAATLRSLLSKQGLAVIERKPRFSFTPFYTVHIEASEDQRIVIDGVDSNLERHIINGIAELTDSDIVLQRAGGVQSDRAIRICVPNDERQQEAVELGCMRGIAWAIGSKETR